MLTYVKAYRSSKDVEYQKHLKVLKACLEADEEKLPEKTAKYFGTIYAEEGLIESALEIEIPTKEWTDGDMSNGVEIKVKDIPSGVEKIRFVNSY